jgi:hypothetical protein
MGNESKGIMSEKSNEELIRIVTIERSDYPTLTLEAAKTEILHRNIGTAEIENIKAKIENNILEKVEEYRSISLIDRNDSDTQYQLVNDDHEKATALQHLMQKRKQEQKKAANKDMLVGGLWLVGGTIATVADIGYVFWGAILFGGIQFFKGVMNA